MDRATFLLLNSGFSLDLGFNLYSVWMCLVKLVNREIPKQLRPLVTPFVQFTMLPRRLQKVLKFLQRVLIKLNFDLNGRKTLDVK